MNELVNVVIAAVLPIALVALSGVVVGRCFEIDLRTLARLNIYLLLPALVITGLYSSAVPLQSAVSICVGFLLNCGFLYTIARLSGHFFKLSPDDRKSLIATTLLANTGNIGLPFILFSLGEEGLARALLYMIASALLIATIAPIFLKGEGIRAGLRITVRLPVLWATVAGVGLQWAGWAVPAAGDRALTMVGDAAIPIALITLGIQLTRTPFSMGIHELLAVGLRLVVSPLAAYVIGRGLGLEGLDLSVLVLQGAMPVAVNTLIWVTEFGGNPDRVAKTIVLSTALSCITLPIILALVS